MHILRLFHRRQSPVTRDEPWTAPVRGAAARSDTGLPDRDDGDNDALTTFWEYPAGNDLRGSDAIFDLVGSRRALTDNTMPRPMSATDADTLMEMLHRQYCQALDSPGLPVTGDAWEAQPGSHGRFARSDPGSFGDPHGMDTRHDSIEALLSGAQVLDHAFGSLGESDLANLSESEPAPEILRLFAPPEYLASAWRSVATRPPTLARRDHHSLGIDSPLPLLEVTTTEDAP